VIGLTHYSTEVSYYPPTVQQQSKEDDMADPFIDVPQTLWERIRQKLNPHQASWEWHVEGWTFDRVDFQINFSNLAVQSSQLVNLDKSEFRNCTSVQADEMWQRQK